jgi:hypothetical protein
MCVPDRYNNMRDERGFPKDTSSYGGLESVSLTRTKRAPTMNVPL